MNLLFHWYFVSTKRRCFIFILLICCLILAGCQKPELSTFDEYVEFKNAGPIRPTVDFDRLIKAKTPTKSYQMGVGDVLRFDLAPDLWVVGTERPEPYEKDKPYYCRVSESGSIKLPIVGEIPAAGYTMAEIETFIEKAYYPKYLSYSPSLFGKVEEYYTENVTVVGAVNNPGIYQCRKNELTLVSLLMKAGGIVDDGAAVIRIQRLEGSNEERETLVLPVEGLNIPFADIALSRGDIVEIEPLNPETFTVIGLVNDPGAFPYPPGTKYNVMQALAFAGGLYEIASPEYVRIYRQNGAGEIVNALFKVGGKGIADASHVTINPGDVVAVEQTAETKSRLLIAEVFRVTLGLNAGAMYRYFEGKDLRRE